MCTYPKCTVSWRNARKYNMGPKITREQGYFHDESTFFAVFSIGGFRHVVFLEAYGLFWPSKGHSAFILCVFCRPSAFLGFFGLRKATFWPSEGRFLTFFASLMPAALRSAKKVKKWPSSGQKVAFLRPKNPKKASGLQKTQSLQASVVKI